MPPQSHLTTLTPLSNTSLCPDWLSFCLVNLCLYGILVHSWCQVLICQMLSDSEWCTMDWRAKQPSQVACFSDDLKCWEAWDTTCGHKAKDITPLITWRREALKKKVLDDLPWKDERGPSSIRQTLEPFQRQRWGNLWETWWNAYGLFRVHRYHLELNWTMLSSCTMNG